MNLSHYSVTEENTKIIKEIVKSKADNTVEKFNISVNDFK